MKHLQTKVIYLLLLFLGLFGNSIQSYAQYTVTGGPIGGNCGNLYYRITTTGTPCLKNGTIKIDLWGPDVEGANPNLSAIQYRAYLKDSDPEKELFVDEHILEGKEAGTYIVEVIGQCKDAQGGKVPLTLSQVVKVDQLGGWSAPKLFRTVVAKSLECTPTGVVDLTGIQGGLPPYEIKFTEKPSTYSGSAVIHSGQTLPTGGSIRLTKLPPGDYKISFKEGSECGGEWTVAFTVPTMTIPASPVFFTALFPGQVADNPRGSDPTYEKVVALSTRTPSATNTDYNFIASPANRSEYFEYAVYYGSTMPLDVNTLTWAAVPSAYLKITMPHTVSQMQQNKTALKPNVLLRIKGCPETIYTPSYTLSDPTPAVTQTTLQCGDMNFKFNFRNDANGVLAYPFDWRFRKINGSDTILVDSGKEVGYANATSSNAKSYTNIDPGKYIIETVDRNGYKKVTSYEYTTISTHVNRISTAEATYRIKYGCAYVQIPCIYLNVSASSSSLKDLDSVIYVKTERNIADKWADEPSFPAPRFSKLKISEIHPDSLKKYQYYLNPWATTINNTVLTSFTSTNIGLINNKTEYPYDLPGYYRHTFRVVDNCGKAATVVLLGERYYYEHTDVEPKYATERLCAEGRTKVTITNWGDLVKRVDKTTGVASSFNTSYGFISIKPTGATTTYHNSTGGSVSYLSAATNYISVNKEGKYSLHISPISSNFTVANADFNCGKVYDLNIDKLVEFELDADNTAMYRCPGNSPGTGHVEISVKNGIGPYLFELRNENRELIASNSTGVFQSGTWSNSMNSDYYWIYGYDYGCAPEVPYVKFEQRVKVYNLSNENSAWSSQPVVCVGDSLVLNALALGKTAYDWVFIDENGVVVNTYSGRRVSIKDVKLNQSGRYVSIVSIPGCNNVEVRCTLNISVGEKLVYWKTNAEDSNWFNTNNWMKLENGVITNVSTIPSKCTSVHIPGNAKNYPDLSNFTDEFGYPVCDTIVYHYGAETAFPNYLNYNRAKIQYNMGYYDRRAQLGTQPTLNKDSKYPGNTDTPTVMNRTRWYMLATPLKQMVGGDFGLAGYPKMYQRLFNTTQAAAGLPMVDGFSRTFNKYTIPTSETGNALALWVPDYDDYLGSKDQTYLDNLEGIIEIPYIYNKSILANRPLHKFQVNGTDSISYFYYFDKNLKPVMDQYDMMRRGYQAFRFVYEDENNLKVQEKIGDEYITVFRMPIPASQTGGRMMIGNPFMSTIDFDKVYELNKDVISNRFQVVTQNAEILQYTIGSPLNDNTTTKYIAPLQAFIVECLTPLNNSQILFHMNGASSVMAAAALNTPFPKTRNAEDLQGDKPKGYIIVDCIAIAATLSGEDFKSRTGVTFNYLDQSNVDMSTFDENLEQRADVFITGDDGFLYRSVAKNDVPKPSVIKFGLLSGFSGDINLPISYDGNIIKKVKFVDTYLGVIKDNVESGWTYSFKHRAIKENGIEGLDSKRFELHVEYVQETRSDIVTDILSKINVRYNNKTLIIESGTSINRVELLDLTGESLLMEKPSDSYYYKKYIENIPGVYLVRVTLENGQTKTTKIIE